MVDIFRNENTSLDSPARSASTVTPNDAATLPVASRALYIGGQGDVVVELVDEGVVTFVGATGFIPVCTRRVLASGTTATDIVALW